MEPLKEMFNAAYYKNFAAELSKLNKQVPEEKFYSALIKGNANRSLNERLRHTSITLHQFLPNSLPTSIDLLKMLIPKLKRGYTNLVFPDYIGLYGHEHFDLSMEALKYFTRFGSSEFAIREYLKRDIKRTLAVMKKWAENENEHVRRLSSEGSRPRLPWSFKLEEVIQNPKLTQPILEVLKEDESDYVKKSVANHLNDVSKDHPELMLDFVKTWNTKHPHSSWIIKHASRTLIKKGHSGSLALFEFEKNPKVSITNFKIQPTKLKLGQTLNFSFEMTSQKSKVQKMVVDYIIHYRKQSGQSSAKVFKLKEFELGVKQSITILKKQVLKDFTTRKHYAGKHKVEIQVNGKVLASASFDLIN